MIFYWRELDCKFLQGYSKPRLNKLPEKNVEISNNFLKKMPRSYLKILKYKMQQQMKYSLIFVLNYKQIISSLFFHWITTFTFFMSILVSWEVFFNVSFSFGHHNVNQLRCCVVLIWVEIAYFQKYLRTCKSKKNCFQTLF